MVRGTTPTNIFSVNVDLRNADVIYISYSQQKRVVFEKTKADILVTENTLTVTLTQEETLALADREVEIQIRARYLDGTAIASRIITTTAGAVLKDGVI